MSDERWGDPPAPGSAPAPGPPPGYAASPTPPGYIAPPSPGYVPPRPAAGYAPAPQQHLFEAYRPGIIRLQALGLGDVLDGAVRAIRYNPRSMIGLSLLVLAIVLVPSALVTAWFMSLLERQVVADDELSLLAAGAGGLVLALFGQLATIVLTGLLIYVVGEAVLGRKPGLGETWRATRGRLPALIGLNLLVAVVAVLGFAVLLTPGIWLLATDNTGLGVGSLVLGLLALVVLSVWLWVKTSLAGPALVLERAGIGASLRRSWLLTRGDFWRLFGIMLLASVIAVVVSTLLQVPFSIAQTVLIGIAGADAQANMWGAIFVDHLASLLSGAVTTPFVAAVVGLLYIDRRIRREALDVVLVRAAQSSPQDRTR